MGLTNFPFGVSSFGMPLGPGGFIPAGGKHFFVRPAVGSDGNPGTDPSKPLDTVEQALSLCTSGNNDVIHLIGNGQASGSSRDTATLAWSKDATHLVGECAPTRVSQRARISPSTTFTPLINVSGDGCIFRNIQFFQGHNAASVCMNLTGERNYFENCHIAGIGHSTAGASTSSRSLVIAPTAGEGENTFVGCQIGVDTTTHSVATIEVDFSGTGAPRNRFIDCDFVTHATASTPLFINVDTGGIDRYTIFKDCRFINGTSSGATTMTAACAVAASPGGYLVMHNSFIAGATDWTAADNTDVLIYGVGSDSATPTFAGIAASVDVS